MRVEFVEKELPFIHTKVSMYECYDTIDGKEESVAGFELDFEDDEFFLYLEHVFRPQKFRGRGYLPKIIDYIFETFKFEKLVCLPLDKYRTYYEKLGFKIYKQIGDDIYYYKEKETK